jgi:transcriptional regulator with XRE-family HTH domain
MITIGKFLNAERVSRKISFEALERKTKIKKEFIEALEKEEWEFLPEFPVVLGFVKNIAKTLGIDANRAVSLLRRDYPPKIVSLNPNPPAFRRLVWGPKLTLVFFTVLVFLFIAGYLGYQAYRFLSPPFLVLSEPKEGQIVKAGKILVSGKTDSDAIVIINNQQTIVDQDGSFEAELLIDKNTKEVVVLAKSRAGKTSQISRHLSVEE